MVTIEGKVGIKATVVCDSISEAGIRLPTFELEYPRIVHSEFMTHRALSKNAASSRAIPAAKMREQLTARPVRFGANVSGMQDTGEEHEAFVLGREIEYEGNSATPAYFAPEAWELALEDAIFWSNAFAEAGYHKQVFNRLTEPFQMIKVVASATELENFFWLRNHSAADPTIAELARCMFEARKKSTPNELKAGEWHLPYVLTWRVGGVLHYGIEAEGEKAGTIELSLQDAIKVSAARCAAVSFRNVDYDLTKCLQVHERLIGDERKHASALEHQATPMQPELEGTRDNNWADVNLSRWPDTWEDGISHMDRYNNLWSGNFRGFIQYRKLIAGENVAG